MVMMELVIVKLVSVDEVLIVDVGWLVGWLVVGFGSDIAPAQEVESATICAGQKRNTFLQVGL